MTVAATIVVVGFVNAGNIADGANGLLAIIALCVFYLAHQHTQSALFFGLFVSVAVFTLYNLASGRIFLGDFGSYGLSAMMAFACLDLLTISDASIWFFAAILSYPCTELVRVITNRLLRNRSPFAADNSHVHNKLFTLLKKQGSQVWWLIRQPDWLSVVFFQCCRLTLLYLASCPGTHRFGSSTSVQELLSISG